MHILSFGYRTIIFEDKIANNGQITANENYKCLYINVCKGHLCPQSA